MGNMKNGHTGPVTLETAPFDLPAKHHQLWGLTAEGVALQIIKQISRQSASGM